MLSYVLTTIECFMITILWIYKSTLSNVFYYFNQDWKKRIKKRKGLIKLICTQQNITALTWFYRQSFVIVIVFLAVFRYNAQCTKRWKESSSF